MRFSEKVKANLVFTLLKVVTINTIILIFIDLLSRLLLPSIPTNLASGWPSAARYSTNYRNYFSSSFDSEANKMIFFPDRSQDFLWTRKNTNKVQDDKIKVLFVGDSFTQGQGVKRKDTYPKKIEQLSSKIITYNRGQSGANIRKIYSRFQENITEIHPQMVVYGYVLNDPVVAGGTLAPIPRNSNNIFKWDFINYRTAAFKTDRHKLLSTLCRYSNILSHIVHQYEKWSVTKKTISHYNDIHSMKLNKKGMTKTINSIVKMKNKTEEIGAEFIVAIFPLFFRTHNNYPFISAHKSLRRELAKHNIHTIDLLDSYRGIKDSSLWVHPTDQHPNDYAHSIAAENLLNFMLKIYSLTK